MGSMGIPLKHLKQTVNIAKNPQVGHLFTVERKESRPQPLNWLTSRLIAKKLATMDAGKAHTREGFWTLHDKVKYVAAVTGQRGVHRIHVCPEPLVSDPGLAKRATKGAVVAEQVCNL